MIIGKKTVLRKCEPGDHPYVLSLFNNREIAVLEGRQEFPISLYTQTCWYAEHHNPSNMHRMIIQDKTTEESLGYASYELFDSVARAGHTAIKLGPDNWRKGFAADALKTLMSFVFFQQNINRLSTHIVEYNTASLKLFTDKCGWQVEGRTRQAVFMNDKFYDNFILGCLKEDFLAFEKDNFYLPKPL